MAFSSVGYTAVGKRVGTIDGDVAIIYSSSSGVSDWTQRFIGPIYPWDPTDETAVRPQTWAQMDRVAFAPDGLTGWAIGSEWSEATRSTASWTGLLIYKTTNGGLNWTRQSTTGLSPASLNDLVVTDATHACAVGGGRRKIQTTNGSTWTNTPALPRFNYLSSFDAYSIDALDNLHMIAVGVDGAGMSAMQWSADGGVNWTGYQSPTKFAVLRSVSMITPTSWIVVGDEETIGRTNNAGATWTWMSATSPAATITAPTTGQAVGATATVVSGMATDVGVGVASVDVAVRREDGKYWNGLTWVPAVAWNSASVSTTSTAWAWTWALEPGQTGTHIYKVSARSTDGIGLQSVEASVTGIKVVSPPDTTPPLVGIGSPSSNTTLTGQGTVVTGTSSDVGGSGVAKVEVVIQRSSDSKYWTGSAWSVTQTWMAAVPASPGVYSTWSSPWSFEPDQIGAVSYTVKARATDVGGNPSIVAQNTGIKINNPDLTAPTVAVTYPSVGATLGGTSAIVSGITTDAVGGTGVSKVELSVLRDSDGTYWNGLTWGASQAWNLTTLSADKSNWSWTWAFNPLVQDGSVGYSITARATDGATLVSPLDVVGGIRVIQDLVAPAVTLGTTSPVIVAPGDATIVSGTASDSGTGIRQVDIAIQSGATYWNGSTWVTGGPIWRAATLGTGNTFSWTWNLLSGQFAAGPYTVWARATDNADNANTVSVANVRVTNVPLLKLQNGGVSLFSATDTRMARRSSRRAVDAFRLSAAGGDITLSALTVTGRDTAPRLREDVAEVSLYLDDGSGRFEPAQDTMLATGKFAQSGKYSQQLTFSTWKTPLIVSDQSSERIWVVYRISRTAKPGDVLGSRVSKFTLVPDAHMDASSPLTTVTSSNAGRTLIVSR